MEVGYENIPPGGSSTDYTQVYLEKSSLITDVYLFPPRVSTGLGPPKPTNTRPSILSARVCVDLCIDLLSPFATVQHSLQGTGTSDHPWKYKVSVSVLVFQVHLLEMQHSALSKQFVHLMTQPKDIFPTAHLPGSLHQRRLAFKKIELEKLFYHPR